MPKSHKNWIITGSVIIGLSVLISACGKDKNSSGTSGNNGYYCDAYGCYQPNNYDPNNQFANLPNGGYSKSTVIASGVLQVKDRNIWKSALDTIINCRQENALSNNSTCGMQSSGNMYLQTKVYDYQFKDKNKTSQGEVIIGGQYTMQAAYQVVWKKSSDGKSFSTYLPKMFTSSYRPGDPSQIRIIANGISNGPYVNVTVKYGNKVIGTGRVNRTNLPAN